MASCWHPDSPPPPHTHTQQHINTRPSQQRSDATRQKRGGGGSHHGSTDLRSDKSVLFPTSMMTTSLPRSVRTSSIHLDVFRKDARSARRPRRCSSTHQERQQHKSATSHVLAAGAQHAEGTGTEKHQQPNKTNSKLLARTCNVVGHHCHGRVTDVAGNETSETPAACAGDTTNSGEV